MAKEFTIISAKGGYILKTLDPDNGKQELLVKANFGAVVKEARAFFDEKKATAVDPQNDDQE